MHVHVVLRVHMVERQTGCSKCFKLRANFRLELRPDPRREKVAHARAKEVALELAASVDQQRYTFGRERRAAVNEYEV